MARAFDGGARRKWALVASLLALIIAAALAPGALAQSDVPKILVIDVQRVMQQSTAVAAIQEQLAERREAYQAELKQKEQEIREDEQALASARSEMTAEEFADQRRALEEKVGQVQREVQERQQTLAELQQEGMERVNQALVQVAQEVAGRLDADLVLGKSAVVLVKPEYEVTSLVLQELNASLPTVQLQEGN
jgi:Skp family chaperone for outer membrane proteins